MITTVCIVSLADGLMILLHFWEAPVCFTSNYEFNCTLSSPLPSHSAVQELKALFYPFSQCEDYLNTAYLKSHLSKPIVVAIKFVGDLSDTDFKDKEVSSQSPLSTSLFYILFLSCLLVLPQKWVC